MIDLKVLRENPDAVRASQRARGDDEGAVDALLSAGVGLSMAYGSRCTSGQSCDPNVLARSHCPPGRTV